MAKFFAARFGARKPGFALYFVFLVAMFVGSAALTIAYVQVQSDREARRAAKADAGFAAREASKQLGEQVALLRATVDQLASNPGAVQAVASPEGCSLTFGGPGGSDGHLDILRLDGASVCSSRPKDKKGRLSGYVGESWVRSAATSKLFRAPLTDKATGAPVALFAAPASGKAVIAGFVDLTTLGTNLDSVYGGNRHAEFLVTSAESRRVIMRSINPRRWIGSSIVRTGFAPGARESERADLDGKRRIYASSAVPGTRWELFVGEDEAQALAAGKRLRNRQLAILLPSLLLILLATLFVYRRVVVPMKQLSDGVKATGARGQFTPVTVSGPAEVTGLADQINTLMASVNAQEAVRRAKEDAERANEAKSRFLTHMSHELRTPLAAITGFAELLQRDTTGEKEQKWIAHIVQGGEHLLDLVNELLEISRIEAGEVTLAIEPVDLRSTVAEVLSLAAPLAAERGIHLELVAGQAPDRPALADEMRLRQVLLNLVSNAIKYNRDAGRVGVSVDENEDGTVRVSITDSGEGIPPEALEKLFSPFERLGAEEGPVEGTGLGLVVTKGLVEAMGGRLHVESVVGTGTTFFFELPTEAGAADQEELAQVPAPAAGHALTGGVLYIDDKLANLQLVESILAELRPGLELRTARDGTAGAAMAEESRPDLLLLDLNLPDMTGEEVLRRLRARADTADVPILILSADSTSRNVTRLLQTGADAYLTKPLEVPQFLDVVDRLLAIR
jgi:signal transduction histidine kinase/CheY-like chemotaxis protein